MHHLFTCGLIAGWISCPKTMSTPTTQKICINISANDMRTTIKLLLRINGYNGCNTVHTYAFVMRSNGFVVLLLMSVFNFVIVGQTDKVKLFIKNRKSLKLLERLTK